MVSREEIQQNLNSALKEKREIKVSVLRMILAVVLNKEKEKRRGVSSGQELKEEEIIKQSRLNDEEIMGIFSSEVKKRKDAILQFEKGNRMDLAEKEKKELEILKKYLPEQMSEEEVQKIAEEAVEKTGAKEMKDMGRVMAEMMPKIKGRADGGLVSGIVKKLLSS